LKTTFGSSEHEHVCIEVLSYERPTHGDYLDDNWLLVDISVSSGEFRGRARAAILTFEFTGFSEQLHALYDTLEGSAEFSPLEGQLSLKLAGDGRGHIQLEGELSEKPGYGCRLSFSLAFDQTQLHTSIRELDAVIRAFPVRNAKA
jgi:hypothetical protein